MLVGSNLITLKIENLHLYIGPSQETLERSILHYYDSVAKLQVINYRFPERSRSGMFQFWEVLETLPHLIMELPTVHSIYGCSCSFAA